MLQTATPKIVEYKPKDRLVSVTLLEVMQVLAGLQGCKLIKSEGEELNYIWVIQCGIVKPFNIGIRIRIAFNKNAENKDKSNSGHALFHMCLCYAHTDESIYEAYKTFDKSVEIVIRTKYWINTFQTKVKKQIKQVPDVLKNVSPGTTYNPKMLDDLYNTLFKQKPQSGECQQMNAFDENLEKNQLEYFCNESLKTISQLIHIIMQMKDLCGHKKSGMFDSAFKGVKNHG